MPSCREAVLQALLAVLTAVPGATVERETAIPERVPQGGLIILRDGDPGPPEIILSPLTYLYGHAAKLEVFVQAGQPVARAIALDGLLRAIGIALSPDRTLGGTCDWIAWSAYVTSQPETIEGWQAWDVATRTITPTMVGRQVVPMIGRALALTLAESLGYDARVVAFLLPAIELGLWEALGKDATPGVEDEE